jgi:hypothetical protein
MSPKPLNLRTSNCTTLILRAYVLPLTLVRNISIHSVNTAPQIVINADQGEGTFTIDTVCAILKLLENEFLNKRNVYWH